MAPLNSVPSEILSSILAYITLRRDLYACALTNRHMHLVAQPLLRHLLRNSSGDDIRTAFAKLQLAVAAAEPVPPRINSYIRHLRLVDSPSSHHTFWTDTRMLILMRNTPHLKEFYLRSAKGVTDASMDHLPTYWPKLATLALTHVPGVTRVKVPPKLTKLILEHCEHLTSDTFATVFQHIEGLQTLGIADLPPELTTEMARWDLILHLPWLTDLRLHFGGRGNYSGELFLMAASPDVWPYLTSFTLYDAYGSDDALVMFLRSHPGIQRLYFRHFHFCAGGLDELVSVVLPCLEELHITDWEQPGWLSNSSIALGKAIRQWIQVCPQLAFVLFWGYGITLPAFPETGVKCADMRGCHSRADCHFLHHLDQEDIEKIRDGYL